MDRQEILLKEYEVCQQDINFNSSRYWTIVGIFIPVNTAILGWMVYLLISNIKLDGYIKWGLLIVLLFCLGMTFIIFALIYWLDRVNSIIRVNYHRMREIEKFLGMRKNCLVDVLDNHWDQLPKEEQNNLNELHKKHSKTRETACYKRILHILIALWCVLAITALVPFFISLIDYFIWSIF